MTEGTWLRCKVDGQHFGARYGAASCYHDNTNTVYLYGGAVLAPGSDGSNIYSDELFALQLNGAKVTSTHVTMATITFSNPDLVTIVTIVTPRSTARRCPQRV